MAKHIGIIAVSSEGAALCYRTICQESFAIIGRLAHPEVSVHTHSLSRYRDYIEKDDWNGIAALVISSAGKLAAAGTGFGICPDNTVHACLCQLLIPHVYSLGKRSSTLWR